MQIPTIYEPLSTEGIKARAPVSAAPWRAAIKSAALAANGGRCIVPWTRLDTPDTGSAVAPIRVAEGHLSRQIWQVQVRAEDPYPALPSPMYVWIDSEAMAGDTWIFDRAGSAGLGEIEIVEREIVLAREKKNQGTTLWIAAWEIPEPLNWDPVLSITASGRALSAGTIEQIEEVGRLPNLGFRTYFCGTNIKPWVPAMNDALKNGFPALARKKGDASTSQIQAAVKCDASCLTGEIRLVSASHGPGPTIAVGASADVTLICDHTCDGSAPFADRLLSIEQVSGGPTVVENLLICDVIE